MSGGGIDESSEECRETAPADRASISLFVRPPERESISVSMGSTTGIAAMIGSTGGGNKAREPSDPATIVFSLSDSSSADNGGAGDSESSFVGGTVGWGGRPGESSSDEVQKLIIFNLEGKGLTVETEEVRICGINVCTPSRSELSSSENHPNGNWY
jgi:hypothetical protein